ncbi:MAG: DUF3090 family protein [Actinomycetota bacterium]|nr:DUF3090 family protein [Actinomycetota bacterium]
MNDSYELDCEIFTAGAVGPPGRRVFYLQASDGRRLVSLKCEKQHVRLLGEYLERILADLPERHLGDLPTELELAEPVMAAWIIGSLGVAYDEDHDRLVVLAEELTDEPEDDAGDTDLPTGDPLEPSSGATARFHVTREQVVAFVNRSRQLMEGGRPPCVLCGRPMDPETGSCVGCPRTNGHSG